MTPLVPLEESIPTKFWKVTAAEAMRFVVEAVVAVIIVVEAYGIVERPVNVGEALKTRLPVPVVPVTDERRLAAERSEERRVGKEGRSRWAADH